MRARIVAQLFCKELQSNQVKRTPQDYIINNTPEKITQF